MIRDTVVLDPLLQEATYTYETADGNPVMRVLRFKDELGNKTFRQQRYENGEWDITKERLAPWLVLRVNPDYENSKTGDDKMQININSGWTKNKLKQSYSGLFLTHVSN